MNLVGQRIVVVGGSSGIGRGVASAAWGRGADVVVVGRNRERLDSALQAIRANRSAHGGDSTIRELRGVTADVTDPASVDRLFHEIGACSHIIVTAADLAYQLVRDLDVDAVQRALTSKILAPLLVAKYGIACLPSDGSITLTSGIAAHRPAPRGALTAAANGAVEAMVRALALELAPVRVNAVSPGWVDTPIWDAVAGENKGAVQSAMAARLPVRRLGTAEDLATAYLFLIENDFTTGTVLHVDGGHRLV